MPGGTRMTITPDTISKIETLILDEVRHIATLHGIDRARGNAKLEGMLDFYLGFVPAPAEPDAKTGTHAAIAAVATLEDAKEALTEAAATVEALGGGLFNLKQKKVAAHLDGMTAVYEVLRDAASTPAPALSKRSRSRNRNKILATAS